MRDAAQAKAALQDMQDAVKSETAAEVAGATQAAAARQKDLIAIRDEAAALTRLADAAKQSNVQLLYGGRSNESAHLADMAAELNYTTLLNRQRWLGFSSVQQAMSYRQQMYQLSLLENKAHFAGYLTADQYLSFMQRETMQTAALSAAIRDRTGVITAETSALLAHANALQGTNQSLGSLGEQLGTATVYATALSGVQPLVRTRAEFDDSQALAQLAAYRAALSGIPQAESVDIISVATRLGGVPLTGAPTALAEVDALQDALDVIDAEVARPRLELEGGPEAVTEAALLSAELEELNRRSMLRIGVSFDQVEAARLAAEALADELALNEKTWFIRGPEIEGAEEAIPDLEAIRAQLDALDDTPDVHKVIYVDDVGAVEEMEAFTRAFEAMGEPETARLELDDAPASDGLTEFGRMLADAARKRYEFQAGLDDSDAIDELDVLEGRLIDFGRPGPLPLGMGGATGGGGGGGPPIPPASAAESPDPDDAAAWDAIERAMRGADNEAIRSSGSSREAGKAAADAGNAARGAGGWWGLWTRDLTLFGGAFKGIPLVSTISVWALALHTLLDFFIVLVPAIVAAGVALGTFAVAIQPAAQDVYNRFEGLHIALDALTTGDSSISKTTQHISFLSDQMGTLNAVMKPVPVTFRTLQDAMAPEAVTLYGAAINTLSHGTGLLGDIVQRTGTWVEDFAIKIQTALTAESGVMGPLIQTALNDLRILGSIGGSLLRIFTEFLQAGEITHVSELLFEGLAYALSVVAKALQIVGPYTISVGIAFFAVVHYGGLLVTALRAVTLWLGATSIDLVVLLGRLPLVGGAFTAFGLDARAALAALSPAVFLAVAAAIVAIGYAIYSAAQASTQAKTYVSGLQAVLASDNATQGFAQIQTNLASMGQWLTAASVNQRNFVGNMAQGWASLFKDAGHGIQVYKDLWEALTGTNQQPGSTTLVLREQTAEQKDWTTTIQAAAYATRQYGTTAQQSFALMDLAGVKVTDSLAVQKTKVDDLVTGWLNMGVQGYQLKNGMNQLGAAIDSVTLAGEIQDSSISALTGDFSTFLTLVTSGETGFETFGSGVATVTTNLKAAGAAMGGVNAASFTLRQSWEAQLTAGQGLYNNLLLQNAAAGNTRQSNAELAASGRDVVSVLLAQGGAGQESVQGTYALAQTMGYTGKATYDALEKWSGGNANVTGTLKDLNTQVGNLEGQSAGLQTDVLNLAAAIGTNLNTAIAQGLVGMPGLTKAVAGLFQYIQANRAKLSAGPTAQEISFGDQVANALIAVYGTTPQGLAQAKNEFLATLSQMGVARQQALQLWSASQGTFVPQMNLTPVQNKLGEMEQEFSRVAPPVINLTPMQSRLSELNREYSAAFVPAPGYLAQSDAEQAKIVTWFTVTMPHGAAVGWSAVYNGFDNDVWHPIGDFFNKAIPGFIVNTLRLFAGYWSNVAQLFGQYVVSDVSHFFVSQIVSFISNTLKLFDGLWSNAAHYFGLYLVSDVSRFFTSSMPDWFDTLGRDWNRLWSTGWSDFDRLLVQPMEHWFSSTMPNAIWGGLKGGIDKAVGGMNTVIGYINDVTGVVGVHIGKIPSLAAGRGVPMASGSVPGTGDEDGTHIIAMGGEWMLRKPARMALQAQFGPDFLDHLNNADTWLGSGSRGNVASQQSPAAGRYAAGGVLGDIGNWLGDAVSDTAGAAEAAWHGVTGAASEVAKFGEQAVFNAMWDLSGKPAEAGLERIGTPGAMGAAWLQDIHNGIETWIAGKTTTATASAGAAGKIGGSGGAVQALAKQMAAARGWTGQLWNDLNAVEMDEAGWNLNAQNPTSDAYGIAQFIDGASEYAQYGGNANTALGQVVAFLNYVQERYGSPAGALAHEEQFHWYALGGPVLSAIRQATSNREEQESMALGSWLLTRWNAVDKDTHLGEYGAFLTDVRKHKGFTTADALDPVKAARLMAPYYGRGIEASTAARWKSRPDQAALYAAAIAQNAAGTRWDSPSAGLMTDAWKEVTAAFTATPESQTSTINKADVAAWSSYAPKIHPAWTSAYRAWQPLAAWNKRGSTSAKDWAAWVAQRGLITRDRGLANTALDPIFANVNTPQQLTAGDWPTAEAAVLRWAAATESASLAKKDHPEFYGTAVKDILALNLDLQGAQHAWEGIWGEYLVPGITVRQPGQPAVSIDLNSLIVGSPFGAGGSGGGDYGFNIAAGGTVPGLADVAGMFGGMAAGGGVPDLVVPGMPMSLQKQLQAQSVGEHPRTLADAAGNRGGLHVGQLTINNPKAEKPSDSITRSSNRLSFLAGRGVALWAGRTAVYTGSHASQVCCFRRYSLRPACCSRRGRVSKRPPSVRLCLRLRG
jgi:hypothetical protein